MILMLRLIIGLVVILPSLWLGWYSSVYLYLFYTDQVAGSYGFNFRFGAIHIEYPWADVFVVVCSIIALMCGLAIAAGFFQKVIMFSVGASMLALIIIGYIGA